MRESIIFFFGGQNSYLDNGEVTYFRDRYLAEGIGYFFVGEMFFFRAGVVIYFRDQFRGGVIDYCVVGGRKSHFLAGGGNLS